MITLHTSLLSENLGFNGEDIQVKSISAAWNKIREIRDTTNPQVLEGTILKVTGEEGQDMSRIPEQILFKLNVKGKMEFKDLAKVKAREAKKEEAAKADEMKDEPMDK
jgi:hypothetical protein